ncbi:P-loop containing nucleoside triphosphate hydrolase protein [Hortaea werneckii]|nr:P-loop containing nucleoside triphosphate hydrolase protein [Hortaea werneckii]
MARAESSKDAENNGVKPNTAGAPSNYALPWVEKYRPIFLDDIVGNTETVERLKIIARDGNMPHVIISGMPGIGKTTSVLCLARQLLGDAYKEAVLELNASDERGIDVVRNRIKGFAQKKVTLPAGRQKIVILDEADSMTSGAQQALRRTMEIYSGTTRFAFACNQSNKIIEPLQSRCAILRYSRLTDGQLVKRIYQICKAENVEYSDDGIAALVFSAEGDMRQAINNLQSTFAGFGFVSGDNVFRVVDSPHPVKVQAMIKSCQEQKVDEALDGLKELWTLGYSSHDIISTMFKVTKTLPSLSEHKLEGVADDDLEVTDAWESEGLEKRADTVDSQTISGNNAPNLLNIQAGNTTIWKYTKELLNGEYANETVGLPGKVGQKRVVPPQRHAELRKRQDGDTRQVFVSINTCLQPTWNATGMQERAPPQLTLYVATQSGKEDVGPGSGPGQIVRELDEGFANVTVNATGDWYIAVHAPTLPAEFVGVWNYELAVSIDDYYHVLNPVDPFLHLVDTDQTSALLVTSQLTQNTSDSEVFKEWMELSPPPFTIFAANQNHTATMGIRNSYCGWSNAKQIMGDQSDMQGTGTGVQMGMTTRGIGDKPREQFYVTYLNGSSSYNAVLAKAGNSTNSGAGVVGGGGKVWQMINFTTKAEQNCALMFNLTFCDEVAYAVPSNPKNYSTDSLRDLYDNYTSFYYQNFNYSLQQIPCNTDAGSKYSLAKGCDDCARAYKQWLCATSIPRCEDFTNPNWYLQPRAMGHRSIVNDSYMDMDYLTSSYTPMLGAPTLDGSPKDQTWASALASNSSRNSWIDEEIRPGPYKELLPCDYLCYNLVASCPSALGFACPNKGRGLETSYGHKPDNNSIMCSYLGAVYGQNAGDQAIAPVFRVLIFASLTALLLGFA